MWVSEIQLQNFRNFDHLQLSLGPGVNVFVGQNGQGKTNLVEAIYLLTHGQSFRPTKTDSFLNKKTKDLALPSQQVGFAGIRVHSAGLDSSVKLQLSNTRKSYSKNNKKISSTQLVKDFSVVLFSPESLNAIKNGPDERRQLLDDWLVLLDPKQMQLIKQFRQTLRTRNKLLKDIRNGDGDTVSHKQVLASLNELYYPLATELTHRRMLALKRLLPAFKSAMSGIFNDENVDISVDYLISGESALEFSENRIFDALINRANQLTNAELDSGITLVGPHKHDVQFLMFGEDSRYYCSQGQQRALILAFKMAQIIEFHNVFNDYPLLMLDDVLSELDEEKRTHLVGFLRQIKAQIFITTTDLSFRFDPLSDGENSDKNIAVFQIENGRVTPNIEKGMCGVGRSAGPSE